jgi:branched-chain amino acid transport system ATP-binding protein
VPARKATAASRNGATAKTPLLELRGVRAAYEAVEVLHGIDFSVGGGSLLAILGANGAGKSTTLRVIAGLMQPRSGQLLLEGHDVTGASADQLARAGVCLIPEGRGIFPNLSVRENMLMNAYSGDGRTAGEMEEAAYEEFPRLGDRRNQVAGTLSGGEQQMLSLSRAFSTDPALILLDELSMGLAPVIVDELFELVRHLTTTGVTIVVVEQFAGAVLDFADHVVVMAQGLVRLQGAPRKIEKDLAAAYLGGSD